MPEGVSVLLPVYRDAARLPRAARCITGQTLAELDILIILNGSDEPTRAAAHDLARADRRIRILELPDPNLSAACNLGLREARHDLVARMDADDLCPPHRLQTQGAAMAANPALAALGSAWELLDRDGRIMSTVRPPIEPADLRWRLLLGNVLAHGSMMMRRDAVLLAGGYREDCPRAQDYELWLRLVREGGGIACLPDVLYQHLVPDHTDLGRSSPEQAELAAPLMLQAWRSLPEAPSSAPWAQMLSDAMCRAAAPARTLEHIERQLALEGPSREGLLAWLWAQWFAPPAPRRVADACKRSRLREVGAALRSRGTTRVWLWGAGDHTRWALEHGPDLGLRIVGIVDDHLAGRRRFGHEVLAPATLQPGDTALISSDWHEDAIWQASAPHRARGVRVVRLYEPEAPINGSS
jgi:hypothetical protein